MTPGELSAGKTRIAPFLPIEIDAKGHEPCTTRKTAKYDKQRPIANARQLELLYKLPLKSKSTEIQKA